MKSNGQGGRRSGAGRPAGKPNLAKRERLYGKSESVTSLAEQMHFFMRLHKQELAKRHAGDSEVIQKSLIKAGEAAFALLQLCYPRVRPSNKRKVARKKDG